MKNDGRGQKSFLLKLLKMERWFLFGLFWEVQNGMHSLQRHRGSEVPKVNERCK